MVFGRPGSFGGLEGETSVPTGQSLATRGVPDWQFLPGQAAYFSALGPDGTVFIANEPQTDNQVEATATQMAISAFDPAGPRLTTIVVPTSTGALTATDPGTHPADVVGGADVADVLAVPAPSPGPLAFISTVPFHGWDVNVSGRYPTLGYLVKQSGTWRAPSMLAHTAEDVRSSIRSGPVPDGDVCPMRANIAGQQVATCGFAQTALLPRSHDLVITQYFDDPAAGRTSGRILVIDTDGRVISTYAYPSIKSRDGRALYVHPRDVQTDPTSRPDDERFVVVFDVEARTAAGAPALEPFTLQEFRFANGAVTPVSAPVLSGERAGARSVGFETASYDSRGNLWAAQSLNGTLMGANLALYVGANGVRPTLSVACAALPDWSRIQWGQSCRPDFEIPATSTLGIVRSLTEDATSHAIVVATLSGVVLPVVPGDDALHPYRAGTPLDLGLGLLVNRNWSWVGPRRGVIDPRRRMLWLPVQQQQNVNQCPTYPCRPASLDQWLFGIDLTQLLGR